MSSVRGSAPGQRNGPRQGSFVGEGGEDGEDGEGAAGSAALSAGRADRRAEGLEGFGERRVVSGAAAMAFVVTGDAGERKTSVRSGSAEAAYGAGA